MKNKKLRCICEGAIFIAIALVLSYLRIRLVPSGGSVDLVMIPLVFFAVRWGLLWGLGAGFVFGTLKVLVTGFVGYTWQAILLDYSIAYMMVGFAGIMRNHKRGIVSGGIIGGLGRFSAHLVSGVVLWGEYMPDEFLNMTMTNTWVYSFLYNSTYMIPNIILVVIFGVAISGALNKYVEGKDIKEANPVISKPE